MRSAVVIPRFAAVLRCLAATISWCSGAVIPCCVLGMLLTAPGRGQGLATRAGAEDREAFRAARATVDPEERLRRLHKFTADYPESALRAKATELALEVALRNFPGRTEEVHSLAAQEIADAPTGLPRILEQARVADALASAEPAGADLPAAQGWAQTALAALTEERFRREMAAAQRRYRLPPLSATEVHRNFERERVLCLAALANVDLREGQLTAAAPLLAEAFRLEPLSGEVNLLNGELALARDGDGHGKGAALEAFERAAATGALPALWRAQALRLYESGNEASGGGSGEAGLERRVDALYAKLFPAVFTLPPRALPAGGHTVLLELFTGSGCDPCVAPDLAVESLLTTYGRHDVAVLVYDENIPRPDPLTTPASETRAMVYRVGSTPEAFLDGLSLPVVGSARADAENVAVGFAAALEDEAAQPSPLRLALKGAQNDGAIVAHATLSLAPGISSTSLPERLVVHLALVQDGIRYSGENGIRFHRMVVRAMGPDTALRLTGGPVGNGAEGADAIGQTFDASFNLRAVGGMLRSYLDAYEHGNDRFGEVHFRTKDLPLDPAQLGLVMWVQDSATHAVLQSAFAAVPGRQ